MPEEKNVWGIHTKDRLLFLQKKVVAIGWNAIGDLSTLPDSRDAFKERYKNIFPDDKEGHVRISVGMLYRFVHEVKIGDYVIYPSSIDRKINIGQITGEYQYVPDADSYAHRRSVKWLKSLPRTVFSAGATAEVGAAMTFFSVKNYADEFLSALDQNFQPATTDNTDIMETVGATADEIIERTRDYLLKELSKQFKGYGLEDFVAELLNAMGYRTTISPHGGDRGIDIIAYKDELPPRIVVQVKSQDSDIKETTIHSLKGAMMPGDYGLFVTLSGYTKNAQKFLNANPIIRGINGVELVNLILKYYDKLSDKYQRMLPLKMVYIPVPTDTFEP